MQFKLTIDTDNAAFTGYVNDEVARILHDLADRIGADTKETNYFTVVDGNGNKVGVGQFI